jgi:hypothetical protein
MHTRARLKYAAAALILAAVPQAAFAQWLDYPTAGVPRTPDEKPNLSAPAPRSADWNVGMGKPLQLRCPVQ